MGETRLKLPPRRYWELLARYVGPQKWRFTALTLLLLGSIGLKLINPQIIGSFIDAAIAGAPARQLTLAGLAFLGIVFLIQIITIGVRYLAENIAWSATNELRADLARHSLSLDMSFHNQHTPGELIERIDGDVAELANFFSQLFITLVGNLLLMLGILIVLFFQDWRIGVVFAAFVVITLLVLNRVRTLAVRDQKAYRQADAELYGFIEEQLNGTEDIRASGAVDYSLRELNRRQREMLKHNRKSSLKEWTVDILIGVIMTIGMLMAVGIGYRLYITSIITIGTVYLLVYYINMLESPIWALTREIKSFQVIGACIERLYELWMTQPTIISQPEPTAKSLPPGPLSLRFNSVTFSYDKDEPIFKDLSFNLEPGAHLGLLGRTGSGKTTMARLVFRLYDPLSGGISLDGSDLRQNSLAELRRKVGIVTQDVQLFRASVRDNLTFFDRSISDQQIHTAIQGLELSDWYSSLPQGLDTTLESGSHSLSAGEAQLLAFTRIFLRDPGLIILDEASSRLDPATETRIEKAVKHLLEGRTAIIIAHRLGTVEKVDQIMILDNGRVSEYGARQELVDDPESRFHRLLQAGIEEVLV